MRVDLPVEKDHPKSLILIDKSRTPAPIKENENSILLFYQMFPYYIGCRAKEFYYVSSAIFDGGYQVWGFSLCVYAPKEFTEHLDPQHFMKSELNNKFPNLKLYIDLYDAIFEPVERDVLRYFDNLDKNPRDIIEIWKESIEKV